jgi:hypothetical protein
MSPFFRLAQIEMHSSFIAQRKMPDKDNFLFKVQLPYFALIA